MGIIKKKPVALAMLGNVESTKQLMPVFDKYGLKLLEKDYITIEELLDGIEENKAEYALISDTALMGIEDGKKEVIRRIRKYNPDIFIALFFNSEKPDPQFRDWAFGYKVYNIYEAMDDQGSFNFSQIMPEIQEKAMPAPIAVMPAIESDEALIEKKRELELKEEDVKKRIAELHQQEQALEQLKQEKQEAQMKDVEGEAEKISELNRKIEELDQKNQIKQEAITDMEEEWEKEKEKLLSEMEQEKEAWKEALKRKTAEKIQKIQKEATERMQYHPGIHSGAVNGSITIGIFNLSHGAGATTTALRLAKFLSQYGKTAIMAYDDSMDLLYAKQKNCIVPTINEDKKASFLRLMQNGFQFILIDFGKLFEINQAGKLNTSSLTGKKEAIEEFLRCKFKIALNFANEWNLEKLRYFEETREYYLESFLFVIVEGKKNEKKLMNYHLNICDRESSALEEMLEEWLGFQQTRRKGL